MLKTGAENWRSKLALKTGTQNWRSKLALKTGAQNWRSKLALRTGAQNWRSNWRSNWPSKLALKLALPSHNLCVGDIVCLHNEPMAPTKWPLARIVEVHPGGDGKVRVITVRTMKGIYKRPIVKVFHLIINLH